MCISALWGVYINFYFDLDTRRPLRHGGRSKSAERVNAGHCGCSRVLNSFITRHMAGDGSLVGRDGFGFLFP